MIEIALDSGWHQAQKNSDFIRLFVLKQQLSGFDDSLPTFSIPAVFDFGYGLPKFCQAFSQRFFFEFKADRRLD
jgi:hypothetical protein